MPEQVERLIIETFVRLFKDRGQPSAIRSDNGLPFASPNGLHNLSKLSVFWLRLAIAIERNRPGNPQQNGRHERVHRTLKQETARPPGVNALGQRLGVKEVDDGIWIVNFMQYDQGYIDLEQRSLQTIDNPFGTRLSPMSPGRTQESLVAGAGFEPATFRL